VDEATQGDLCAFAGTDDYRPAAITAGILARFNQSLAQQLAQTNYRSLYKEKHGEAA